MSGYEIARKIKRSKIVTYNFLKNPKEYGKKKHTDRLSTLIMRQKQATAHRACSGKQSSTQIKTEMNLSCTSRTVSNAL